MKITILCVGKIKEKYLKDAVAEYSKRLGSYCKLTIKEVDDEADDFSAKSKEGIKILKLLSDLSEGAFIFVLTIDGKQLSSEDFAQMLTVKMANGFSEMVFIIGGSTGLSEDVIKKAHYKLSFSKFTFPHMLMRVILLEQVYRGFRIIRGEPYHK